MRSALLSIVRQSSNKSCSTEMMGNGDDHDDARQWDYDSDEEQDHEDGKFVKTLVLLLFCRFVYLCVLPYVLKLYIFSQTT